MPRTWIAAPILLFALIAPWTRAAATSDDQREFAIDLWDWTAPCQDLKKFKTWADDFKKIGGTRLELSAPWRALEPEEGKYDLSFISDRLNIAKAAGLGLRVRINSYYSGATPAWLKAEHWKDANGKEPQGTPNPVSISDERFLDRFQKLAENLAASFPDEDIYWSPFIGVHAELKWSDWWTFDTASLKKWRAAVTHPRPQWLTGIVGDADLPLTSTVPQGTSGQPDLSPQNRAFIAFREQCWREALLRFNCGIRQGDPSAKTSAPLGESYRKQSAEFSNLDYVGLSRGFDQVVHSYDFFWHLKDDPWYAAAAVASFHGLTRKSVVFEFDGPALTDSIGYTPSQLSAIADAVIAQGAGIKAANYSYSDKLPSQYPVLVAFGKKLKAASAHEDPLPGKTTLLFISKWTNYAYREKTEWLHDAQFGAWKMLTSHGQNVRFICEDNLDENLAKYQGLYVAFSPLALLPIPSQEKLLALETKLPTIIEIESIPSALPTRNAIPNLKRLSPTKLLVNLPLAYTWLHADRPRADALLNEALTKTGLSQP